MAIRLTGASSEYLRRTTSLWDLNAAYTAMAWLYPTTLTTGSETRAWLFGFNSGNFASRYFDIMGVSDAGQVRYLGENGGSTAGSGDSGAISASVWSHLTLRRSSVTLLEGFKDGVALGTIGSPVDVTGRPAMDDCVIGCLDPVNGGLHFVNGRIAALKIWTAALTTDEIQQEMYFYTPQRTASIHAWSPCLKTGDAIDYNGAGLAWTETNTPTTEDGPPIAWRAQSRRRWYSLSAAAPETAVRPRLLTVMGIGA